MSGHLTFVFNAGVLLLAAIVCVGGGFERKRSPPPIGADVCCLVVGLFFESRGLFARELFA